MQDRINHVIGELEVLDLVNDAMHAQNDVLDRITGSANTHEDSDAD